MRRLFFALDIAIALGLVACAYQPPGAARAVSIVWHEVYSETGDAPTVVWVTAPDLDCHRDRAGQFDGWKAAGCVAGLTDTDAWVSQVADPADAGWMLHTSALAHELLHADLYLRTGDPDVGHTSPDWKTLLPAANAQLASVGL